MEQKNIIHVTEEYASDRNNYLKIYLDQDKFFAALAKAEIIDHAATMPERELDAVTRWVTRNLPESERGFWLDNGEIQDVLVKVREKTLTLLHIKEYDAMVFVKQEADLAMDAHKGAGELKNHIIQKTSYLVFCKNPQKLPLNLGRMDYELNNLGLLEGSFCLRYEGDSYIPPFIFSGKRTQDNQPTFKLSPHIFAFKGVRGYSVNGNAMIDRMAIYGEFLADLKSFSSLTNVANIASKKYKHLDTDQLEKAIKKAEFSIYKKRYLSYLDFCIYRFYGQHILPFLGFVGDRRRALEVFRKSNAPLEAVLATHKFINRVNNHQLEIFLRYRAFLSILSKYINNGQYSSMAQKDLHNLLHSDKKLVEQVFCHSSNSVKTNSSIKEQIKNFLDSDLIKPRFVKALQKLTPITGCVLTQEKEILFFILVSKMEPSALPRTANDWLLLALLFEMGVELSRIKNIKKFCQKHFGRSRPTQKVISDTLSGVRDYKRFLTEIVKNSSFSLSEMQKSIDMDLHYSKNGMNLTIEEKHRSLTEIIAKSFSHLSFSSLLKESNYWHENINRINYSLTEIKERQWANLIDGKNVARLECEKPPYLFGNKCFSLNGVDFCQLETQKEFLNEGFKMSHCVSSYYHTCQNGLDYIFSLEGSGVSTLHINLGVIKLVPVNAQHKTKYNGQPNSTHKTAAAKAIALLRRRLADREAADDLTSVVLDYHQKFVGDKCVRNTKIYYEGPCRESLEDFKSIYPALKSIPKLQKLIAAELLETCKD